MNQKDLAQYKKKYHRFRHHAWAGLGILSVLLAIRLIFIDSTELLAPFILILAVYILIAIVFTYRYSGGLSADEKIVKAGPSVELEKAKIDAEIEKQKLKIEKKKAKAEAKAKKKEKK